MSERIPTIEQNVPGRDGRPGLLVKTPFSTQHEDVTAALKQELPQQDRYFHPPYEGWWVAPEHIESVKRVLFLFWASVQLFGADGEDDQMISRDGIAVSQGRLL